MPDLEWLRRQYPRWSVWRGQATAQYWAMPPPGHPTAHALISAYDLDELARRLAAAEGAGWPAELGAPGEPRGRPEPAGHVVYRAGASGRARGRGVRRRTAAGLLARLAA